jgi:predicted amidohydrolase
MRVAAAQCESVSLEVDANLGTVDRLARDAAAAGAGLLVCPELFLTGATFAPGVWDVAPQPDDATERRLGGIARDRGVHLVVGSAERRGADLFNTALCAAPDGTVTRYSKLHLFAAEPFTFRAGAGPLIWETALGRVGIGICFDLLFATPWAAYAGAVDVCAVPSAWPDFAGSATVVLGLRVPTPMRPGVRRARDWIHELPGRIGAAVGAPVVIANHCGTGAVALLDERAVGELVWAGGAGVHAAGIVRRCAGPGEALAVADVGPAGPAGPPYPGVDLEPLGWDLRAALVGLTVAEWAGRLAGYRVVRARARLRAGRSGR